MFASPVIGHCMAYLSFFGRLGWPPDARTAVGFGVGPWNGPMGDSQEVLRPCGAALFLFFSLRRAQRGLDLSAVPFCSGRLCASEGGRGGSFACCGKRPGGSAPGPRDFLKKIE